MNTSRPIDLSFRPKTYFWPLGLEKHLLTHVKGAARRAALQTLRDGGLVKFLDNRGHYRRLPPADPARRTAS